MYDYINDIHYLLPRLNDLAYGTKKNSQLKADCSKFQSIKKRNITQQYYNVFSYEKKGNITQCIKKSLTARMPLERNG